MIGVYLRNIFGYTQTAFANKMPIVYRGRKYYHLGKPQTDKTEASRQVAACHQLGFRAVKIKIKPTGKYSVFIGRVKN